MNEIEQTVERIGQLPKGAGHCAIFRDEIYKQYPSIVLSAKGLKALANAYTKVITVLKMANIEIVPDGHQFSPKAVAAYCGDHTQKRIEKLEADLATAKQALERYATQKDRTVRCGACGYENCRQANTDRAKAALAAIGKE